jgi:hypothetical protein
VNRRTYRDYLRSIRDAPGFWLRVASTAAFFAASVHEGNGVGTSLLLLLVLFVVFPVAYLFWRRKT